MNKHIDSFKDSVLMADLSLLEVLAANGGVIGRDA